MRAREPGSTTRADARLATTFLAAVALTSVPAVYAFHSAMPYNPIKLPFAASYPTRAILPEGWKFFTRDAQEERLHLRARDASGAWADGSLGPSSSPHNLFGLDRSARAQPVELEQILRQIPKAAWKACPKGPDGCLDAAPVAATLANTSSAPTLCGELGLVLQKPVPWAWARQLHDVVMPSKIVKVVLTCSR